MARLVREPIYQQLVAALRGLMDDGSQPVGSKFLTEREIASRFEVSRATANKALSALVAEGRLDFRKGVGTFVRRPELAYDVRQLVSFTAKARAAGKTPSTRILRFEQLAADQADATALEALDLGEDDPVFVIERLRLADDEPVIHELRVVPVARCPELNEADVAGSIYTAWTERHGLAIGGAEQSIRAENLARDHATTLGVTVGSAALVITARGHTADGQPLWWERTRYRGDAYAFTVAIGTGNAAPGAMRLVEE